ncbi:unannotated protein [freshwater metagenome]|uniref:Unannotated protein n=1 Tax=freshwater metagenome TaxID=449393 RepID=A0A6J6BAY4_9ZZZZ
MPPMVMLRPTTPPMATSPAIATTGALEAMDTSMTSMADRTGVLRGKAQLSTRLPRASVIENAVMLASVGSARPDSVRNAVGVYASTITVAVATGKNWPRWLSASTVARHPARVIAGALTGTVTVGDDRASS